MVSHSKIPNHSETTPTTSQNDRVEGGTNRSFSDQLFQAKGRTDAKLKMMKKLQALGVGFEELEKINISFNLRIQSETLKNQMREGKFNNKKLVNTIMETIVLDEVMVNKEQTRLVEEERRRIKRETGPNTRRTRVRLKHLNKLARDERLTKGDIYEKKIGHLKKKYQENKDKK